MSIAVRLSRLRPERFRVSRRALSFVFWLVIASNVVMGSDIASDDCSAVDTINITVDEVNKLLNTPTDSIIVTIVLPVILCLGAIFNSTFLFVVFRVPKVRSDTTLYLLHLAVADSIFLITVVCFSIFRYLSSPLRPDFSFTHSVQCIVYTFVTFVGYFAQLTLITMMSFERYLALCHPLKHLKIRGRRRTLKIITWCWLVGIVCTILILPSRAILLSSCLQWSDNDGSSPELTTVLITSSPVNPWVYNYAEPLVDIPYLTAMIANIYMYIKIILMLNKRGSARGMLNKDKRALQIRNQVAKMLITNGAIFFICQTPFVVLVFTYWFRYILGIETNLLEVFGSVDSWILILPTLVNTIVNPIVYGVMNAQYRAAFLQAFGCTASPNARPQVQNLQAVNAAFSTATRNTADPNPTISSTEEHNFGATL